ncbi:hypothetical protein G6F46_009949 [Rhizopus delemar]|nr:hypothetical protein G6F55_008971 [Rhizopus delemar]KAG1548099.1 hypothetical protein G6F51_003863 [Rhizopus arrhizus]KAG1492170.1 hypothetical protein G6F54_009500 [Rhizopus delemar]KAG1510153.1 hypothetical protein G6F53_006895 [Rhizopus delemar]KAG1524706.1 hypothetical protein G6F52_003966 [Rhizopus delemar]
MMNRIMMVFSTLVLETVLCRSAQNVKTNFSDKQALEDEIQSLSVQVTQKIQTIQDSRKEWRQEGEHIIKSLERTTLDTKSRPERVNYMEIKLQLEKTLRQIKKKKLSKLKSNNELRKRLAQIVNAPQEIDPFFILPKLPSKEEEEEDDKHNDREPSFIKEVHSYMNSDQNEENMEHDHDEDASSLLNDMESVAYIGSEDPPSAFMYEDIRTPQQMRTPQRTSQVYQDEALFDLNLLTPLRRSVTPRRWSHLGGF